MSAPFYFTPKQRIEIIKELGADRGVSNLEQIVQEYRDKCHNKITPADVRTRLQESLKHARSLRRKVESLAKATQGQTEWIIAPLLAYENQTDAYLKYRFSSKLKRGRPPHIPTIQLVQASAALWVAVRGKNPGRGRGPFSRLISKMLKYSGVPGAPTKYPEELVAEALPAQLTLTVVGPGYPFTPLDNLGDLSPLNSSAEAFFHRIDMVVRGEPTQFVVIRGKGGKKAKI